MLKLSIVLVVLVGGSLSSAELFNPYVPGPHTVLFKNYRWNNTVQIPKNLDIYAPTEAGTYPVIHYSNSLAANIQTDTSVKTFLNHVASWGFVVMAPWKANLNVGDNYKTDHFHPTIEFTRDVVPGDLIAMGADAGFALDTSRMILMGHSAGNHINVNYLKETCGNFTAAILLSPVDGADPFGIIDEFTITPGQKLNFELPTLTMEAALDPIQGTIIFPPCAPANFSNMRFYNAMSGNRWFVNATLYGHTDFFEPEFSGAVDYFHFCATDSGTDKPIYTSFIAGSVVAFAKAMLEPADYCDMLAYVEYQERMTVATNVINDVVRETACQAQCTWSPPPPEEGKK